MKHWIYYLPEVGRSITRQGDAQQNRFLRINSLKQQIKLLENDFEEEENSIEKQAADHWTTDEIKTAKLKAQNNES